MLSIRNIYEFLKENNALFKGKCTLNSCLWCQPQIVLEIKIPIHMVTVQTLNCCTSQPDASQCLDLQTLLHGMSKNKPSTSMTHAACKSKLLSNVRSSIYPFPGNWVATEHAVVYYARADHTFSAGIECLHSTRTNLTFALRH